MGVSQVSLETRQVRSQHGAGDCSGGPEAGGQDPWGWGAVREGPQGLQHDGEVPPWSRRYRWKHLRGQRAGSWAESRSVPFALPGAGADSQGLRRRR